MDVPTKAPLYRIYLLTVWQTARQTNADAAEWRFHLTDPHTGKRYGFTNATALLVLLQQLAIADQADDTDQS